MKYIITESRLDNIIYDYIKSNYYPDYNWGPELHKFYKEDVKRYGYYDFLINDVSSYVYLGDANALENNEPKTLVITDKIVGELNDLFGDRWKPVFVKWFEENSGLKVDHLSVNDLQL